MKQAQLISRWNVGCTLLRTIPGILGRSQLNMSNANADQKPLLERLGGTETLDAAIDEFYFRLVCDEELLVFFEGVNLEFLKRHQRNFLNAACTDFPDAEEAAKRIARGHARMFGMGLSEVHFDMVAQHLTETLLCMGVQEELIDEVVANVAPIRAIFQENAKKHSSSAESHPYPEDDRKDLDTVADTVCSSDGSQHGSGVDDQRKKVTGKKKGTFSRLRKRLSASK